MKDMDELAKLMAKPAKGEPLLTVGSACSQILSLVIGKQHGARAVEQFRAWMRTYGYQDFMVPEQKLRAPYVPPVARNSDHETSHAAAASKDEYGLWRSIVAWLKANGPGTEEMILLGMGMEQRSSGSSAFKRMQE